MEWFLNLICHRDPDRCMCLMGWHTPVCSRCFGIYVAFALGLCFLHMGGHRLTRRLPMSALYVTGLVANGLTLLVDRLDTNVYRLLAGAFIGGVSAYLVFTRTRWIRISPSSALSRMVMLIAKSMASRKKTCGEHPSKARGAG